MAGRKTSRHKKKAELENGVVLYQDEASFQQSGTIHRGWAPVGVGFQVLTPFARFTAKMECLREAPANLRDYFRKTARRRVAKDRTISLDGRIFEAPVALIGRQVSLLYHEGEEDRIEVLFNGQSHGLLRALDLHVNCRVKRDKNNNIEIQSGGPSQTYKGGSLWGKKGDQ